MTPKQFKTARKALNLSQAALGRELDKDTGTISRYERGTLKIPKSIDLAMGMLAHIADSKQFAETIGL